MKRLILTLTVLMCLSSGASAQKWLKSVEKALKTADKLLDSTTESSAAKTASSGNKKRNTGKELQFGDVTATNGIPGLSMTLKGVTRKNANTCQIDLLFTNTGASDIIVYGFSNEEIQVFDTEGNQYTDNTFVMGNNWVTWGGYKFLPDVPTRVLLNIDGLQDSKEVVIYKISIPTSISYDGTTAETIELKNITIPAYASASNTTSATEPYAVKFPSRGQWHGTSDEGEVILDFDSQNKSFMIYGETNYGFIIVQSDYGSQANVIEQISINGNKATIQFINFKDYNLYGANLTYDGTNQTIRLDNLEMIKKNPDFNKMLINIPESIILKKADKHLEYDPEE